MISPSEEYKSLRQELLEHQNRRLTILSVTLTICLALFAAGAEMGIVFLPLLALVLLYLARVQISKAQHGVARIAAYIQVILELENPSLNWEIGSYWIRDKEAPESGKTIKNSLFPLNEIDQFIRWTGGIAILIASSLTLKNLLDAVLSSTTVPFTQVLQKSMSFGEYMRAALADLPLTSAMGSLGLNLIIVFVVWLIWLLKWNAFSRENAKLATLEIDQEEVQKWIEFKKALPEIRLLMKAIVAAGSKDEASEL